MPLAPFSNVKSKLNVNLALSGVKTWAAVSPEFDIVMAQGIPRTNETTLGSCGPAPTFEMQTHRAVETPQEAELEREKLACSWRLHRIDILRRGKLESRRQLMRARHIH
jgi:hypothetical protein